MTFTVLARDIPAGLIGVAVASKSLAAGNAVPALRPGVGAVASQAWTNRALRALLLDALASGETAEAAVARVPEWDAQASLRQVALLPASGAGAARTGDEVSAWAGHRVLADAIVVGNLLTGSDVLARMADRVKSPRPSDDAPAAAFAHHLVEVLRAGETAGGDARGRQSAAVLVGDLDAGGDIRVDLRVDDHDDPLTELTRLVTLRAADLRERVSARTE